MSKNDAVIVTGWQTETPSQPSIPRGKSRKRVRPSKRVRRDVRKGKRVRRDVRKGKR